MLRSLSHLLVIGSLALGGAAPLLAQTAPAQKIDFGAELAEFLDLCARFSDNPAFVASYPPRADGAQGHSTPDGALHALSLVRDKSGVVVSYFLMQTSTDQYRSVGCNLQLFAGYADNLLDIDGIHPLLAEQAPVILGAPVVEVGGEVQVEGVTGEMRAWLLPGDAPEAQLYLTGSPVSVTVALQRTLAPLPPGGRQ